MEHAKASGFTLLSHDADFADMASMLGPIPKVIWLRCGNQPTAAIEAILRIHAEAIAIFAEDRDAAFLEVY
jgi:predicted nuclease of predicted toxin-antitoxin system